MTVHLFRPADEQLTGGNPAALAVIDNNVSGTFRVLLYDPPTLGFAEDDKGCSAAVIDGKPFQHWCRMAATDETLT
jgi:hypothetical protein